MKTSSYWSKVIRFSGRIRAVWTVSGTTYVEVSPKSESVWAAISERVSSFGAVPVKAMS